MDDNLKFAVELMKRPNGASNLVLCANLGKIHPPHKWADMAFEAGHDVKLVETKLGRVYKIEKPGKR